MSDTTFSAGTIIASAWLQDINDAIYRNKDISGQNYINVKSSVYGAVGNGIADDTTAIQAALTAAKPGNVVYFPPGTYKITAVLTLTAGVTLQGASGVATVFGVHTYTKNPSRIWQSTAATHCLQIIGNASVDTVCDTRISDLGWTPVQTPAYNDAPATSKYAIQMRGTTPYSAYRCTIERCTFFSFDRAINVEGYDSGSGVDWQMDSVLVERNAFFQCGSSIKINTTNADAWKISTNIFAIPTNGVGIYLERSGYIIGEGNYAVPGYDTGGTISTTSTFYRLGAWPDNIKMIQEAGSDGLQYFLNVDTSTGYENVYNIIELDGCIVEAPCLAQKQCKIVSHASRYTYDFTCSGNDIEVHSYADSWFPTTKKFLMTGLRPRLFIDPGSTQTKGSVTVGSTVLGVSPTTMFTLPVSAGTYVVVAYLAGGGATYSAIATIIDDGTNLVRPTGGDASGLAISVSGHNVQCSQNSGVSQTIAYSYYRTN